MDVVEEPAGDPLISAASANVAKIEMYSAIERDESIDYKKSLRAIKNVNIHTFVPNKKR